MSKILINSHGKALMNNDGQVYKSPEKPDLIEQLCNDTLTSYSNSNITKVREYLFNKNTNLESVYLPNVTSISSYSFSGCSKLKSIDLTKITIIGNGAFENCSNLKVENIYVTSINSYAFDGCSSIENLILHNATNCYAGCFADCTALKTLKAPVLKSIVNNMFSNCTSFIDIYLGYDGLVSLANVNGFKNVPSGLKVHVKSAYIDQYATATNWSALIDNGTIVIVGDYSE